MNDHDIEIFAHALQLQIDWLIAEGNEDETVRSRELLEAIESNALTFAQPAPAHPGGPAINPLFVSRFASAYAAMAANWDDAPGKPYEAYERALNIGIHNTLLAGNEQDLADIAALLYLLSQREAWEVGSQAITNVSGGLA